MSDIENLGPLILYPPESTTKSSAIIVAVHGINGERTASWTNTDGTMWLRDLLPRPDRIPSARIMTFGYVSEPPEAISAEGIRKTALELLEAVMKLRKMTQVEQVTVRTGILKKQYGCPIIFIGHNIGGSIIKQALLIANNENRYLSIATDTSLLVFFGTPHRALTFADWNDLTVKIAAVTLNTPKAVFSGRLKSSAKTLMDLSAEFLPFAEGVPILNITDNYLGKNEVTVSDEYSTSFGSSTEKNLSFGEIHTGICKLSMNDARMNIVYDEIQRSMTTARKYDIDGIVCLQTFRMLNLENYQSAIPWPGPDLIISSWIFSHETYIGWLGHAEPTILCLYGKPGSGKSVLSSLVIRNLRLSCAGKKRAIVFFFCNEQDERRRSTRDLLSSLIRQLLLQQPSLFTHVRILWERKADKSNWTRTELQVLFRTIIYSREEVEIVCIIDSLDKCDPSHLELWEDLVDATTIHKAPVIAALLPEYSGDDDPVAILPEDPGDDSAAVLPEDPGDGSIYNDQVEATPIPTITESSLKFMITTRRALETDTPRGSCFSIDIETQGRVRDDMVSLLAVGVKDLVQKRPGFSGFEELISTKLLSAPDATLLTTSLCLGELETMMVSSAPASIRKKLESISFTSDEIYARHLQSVSPDWREWAHDVLLWVVYAVRPLTILELALALAIKPEDKSLAAIGGNINQDLAGDIERVFHGLIIIDHDEVRLAHPRVKEFVLCGLSVQKYWYQISSSDPHCWIARTCLTYLSMEDFRHVSSLAEVDRNRSLPEPRWGFLAYAAHHWHEHYRLVGEGESGMLSDILSFLTEQVEAKGLYWSIPRSDPSPKWDSVLHIAAVLGLREVVLELLSKTASDEQVTKAVEWAARNGHDTLVKRLLKGPEYHLEIGPDSSAMCNAAQSGHASIVKMLLEHETKADLPAASGNRALPLAAHGGHIEVVKMLLVLGVDLASRSTALDLAVLAGHEAVVRLILETGDIDPEGKSTVSERRPLHIAARCGYVGIVRDLLAHRASAQSVGYHDRTPLHLSAWSGHLNITNQLLEAGAAIDPLDEFNFTPLHYASKYGRPAVVDYLLNAGADGDSMTKVKESPLYLSVKYRHTKVMERLLDAGVDVNKKCKGGWTALHVAVNSSQLDVVELLLQAGADVDARTRNGSTTLLLAAQVGSVGITKLLLDNEANPRQTNRVKSTPLHSASHRGHVGIVKLLLAAGASPLAERDGGETPLELARAGGHAAVLAELDVNHQDKDGRTRLFLACSKEAVKDIQRLLEAKADTTVKDKDGRLALDVLLSPTVRLLFLKSVAGVPGVAEIKTLDGHPHCVRPQRDHMDGLSCAKCYSDIVKESTVFYYHCCKCAEENYDICRPCYDGGARCHDDEHTMRLRVIADRLESFAEYTPSISQLKWPLVESSDITDESKVLVNPEVAQTTEVGG